MSLVIKNNNTSINIYAKQNIRTNFKANIQSSASKITKKIHSANNSTPQKTLQLLKTNIKNILIYHGIFDTTNTHPPKNGTHTSKMPNDEWRQLIPQLNEKINTQNFLGRGRDANVFAINNKYVLRIQGDVEHINSEFFPVPDFFEGQIFGQPVAQTKEKISINRRVYGTPLYKCANINPQEYMQKLREYANLPNETLKTFVADVAFINSKGWRIDQTNSENFLFDKNTKKIGIIDLCPKNSNLLDLTEPYGHDWIIEPLVNAHNIPQIYTQLTIPERKELFALLDKIEKRVLSLCKKYNIPQSKWNEKDYTYTSLINILDLKEKIDVTKCDDLYAPIIYTRYPQYINDYEDAKKL